MKDEVKKLGDADDPDAQKAKQEIFDDDHDPTREVEAEDTIRAYTRQRLSDFHGEIERAMDGFEAWIASQQEDFRLAFDQRGFLDYIGDRFELALYDVGGGAGRPLIDAMVAEVHNAVAFEQHAANNLSVFVNNAFRRGVRDACWFVRDAAPGLLHAHWDKLLSLAANGQGEFIHTLNKLGLPSRSFKPEKFTSQLKKDADAYRMAQGLRKKDIEEKGPEDTEKKAQLEEKSPEEQAKKDMIVEGEKKPATVI